MNRLRWLFNLLAGLSLLLCIAVTALCVRSHWIKEGFGWDDTRSYYHHYGILSDHGSLVFTHDNIFGHPEGWEIEGNNNQWGPVMSIDFPEDEQPDDSRVKKWLRSIGIRFDNIQEGEEDILILPDWLLIALFALLPLWFLIRWKNPKRERERLGLCLNCGYDLRATPERCPECGTVPPFRSG